jgi:hypothetical protein
MTESNFTYGITQNLLANIFTKTDNVFSGWATSADGQAVYSDQQSVINLTENDGATVTLFAIWQSTIVPGANLAAKLSWLETNALSNVGYTIEVNTNEIIAPHNFSYAGRNNVSVTIKGIGNMRIIAFSTNGVLFTISSGVTLVLDNNITLQGRASNTNSTVRINSGGTLVMNNGSIITGNNNNLYNTGGGITVNNGTFTMNGGVISNNISSVGNGGGVHIISGTFIMNSGNISNNSTSSIASNGGGVHVRSGIFTMNGGNITDNSSSNVNSDGGGVFVSEGIFNMSGGTIKKNVSSRRGGGVCIGNGTFIKTGNSIITGYVSDIENGNRTVSPSRGHAVYASSSNVTKRIESSVGEGVDISYHHNNGSPIWWGNWE